MRSVTLGTNRPRDSVPVHSRRVYVWDVITKLVLFDIDGTLLHTHGAGRRAIHAALLAEVGALSPDSQIRFDGKTDPQIVRELLEEVSHADRENGDRIAAVCRRYVDLLAAELEAGTCGTTVYPGIADLLDRIEERHDSLLGLLTGNVVDGARLKLSAAGIAPERFRVGAFGSDHHDRSQLPAIAAERAAALMGRRPAGAEIVILGDTPADMTCGRSVGARAIGVATGHYSVGELRAAGAFAVFEDFGETVSVLDAIYA
jgi:phosphoglycolate phosphatase-like HAD superfamily hydrolase